MAIDKSKIKTLEKLKEKGFDTANKIRPLEMEEVFENREQIEISRYYEKLPKPTLLATQEFIEGNVYWRDPSKDQDL